MHDPILPRAARLQDGAARVLSCTALLLAPGAPALAETGDVSIGIGAAVGMDLPDPVSREYARFGPGAGLQVPVRWSVAPNANVRFNGRADFGGVGTDRVTWAQHIDGETVRFYAQDHWAMMLAGALTAGPELVFPVGSGLAPYLGAAAGVSWVGTYHALGEESLVMFDPAQNDLGDPKNVDPYTSQAAFITDLTLGAMTRGTTSFWFEAGYSNAWVGARTLQKTIPELDARREAYGWNAARLGLGLSWAL